MKNSLHIILMMLSFSAWADCPDENSDLLDKLSKQMRKGSEIIAVVKGTLGTLAGTGTDSEADEYWDVSTVEVTQSYGLAIPAGRYFINYTSYWGQGCIYDEEKPRRPSESEHEKSTTVYFAISRLYGNTLTTPENEERGLFLINDKVLYQRQDGSKYHIEQRLFEHKVLTGIPKKLWQPEHP
ncbi:hypothetical protein J2X66_000284 [Pseudomonas sp. 3296]|jgi:hypothetical protein|uniref:hypothetical protein n=1 Tax=Pseudomonas sp. 3296 TaxID=2817753 RepID=UPI00285F8D4C|nr:hypothetical protein [Pseudomonas sp. 3296]MDR6913437.1 hypothetical protein [Pseudomonas sp. 3296]